MQVRTHAQKCWNESMANEPLSAIGTHLGECDVPARESPKKKAKVERVRKSDLEIGRQLNLQSSTLDLLSDDLLPDDFLKGGLALTGLDTPTSSALSKDLSTLALSPHLCKENSRSLLCNAPEHWENSSNVTASTDTTTSETTEVLW